jgi:hypothetical protein
MADYWHGSMSQDDLSSMQTSVYQLAFAAYDDAWKLREASGSVCANTLTSALQARGVPAAEYARGTRLHRALYESWDAGRPADHMHRTILKFRLGLIRPEGRRNQPLELALPGHLKPAVGFTLRDPLKLPFTPSGLFSARVGRWWELAADEDFDARRDVPVWLDIGSSPQAVPVMVGSELAGHTDVPQWLMQHMQLAPARRRRRVITGHLPVKRRKDGSWKTMKLRADVPKHDD